MPENTTNSCTRKLKRLLLLLLAVAMLAGSLMAAFIKTMTVKAEEDNIEYFDSVHQLEAGHVFIDEKDIVKHFVAYTTDAEDGYKTAEKSDIKITWFKYFGLTENTVQWEKNHQKLVMFMGSLWLRASIR